MACGGGRLAACLRSSSPVPLSRCRSFACCYATHVARAVRSCSGCCGAFYGLFYPLSCRRWRFSKHALKWHPVASYGHFRRCCPLPFLGSPRRLVLAPRPLFPALSRRRCHGVGRACFRWQLVKTARLRSFGLGSFSASCVMVWMASGTCCRVGRMASAGRLACLYRFARPLPPGAGDYVRSAGVGFVCGEGVGVSLRFSLSRGPRGSVVVSSHHLCCHRLSVCLLRCPSCVVSPPSTFSPRSLPPFPMCSVLAHLCSRVVSYRLSPRFFDELGGAFFDCLSRSLRLSSSRLVFLTRFARLRSSSLVPVLACPTVDRSRRPRFRPRHCRRLCSYLVAVLISFVPPRSSTSVGWAGVGSLFACLPPFSDAVSPIVRAGGRRAVACLPLGWRTVSSAADCGRRGRWRGSLLASDGGGRCGVVGVLCSVCGVVVCIYELGRYHV